MGSSLLTIRSMFLLDAGVVRSATSRAKGSWQVLGEPNRYASPKVKED